jgi:outer membrane beta-barrel protein
MKRALAIAALLSTSTPAFAQEEDDDLDAGRVIAVEPRPFRLVHELGVAVGVLPLDALYTGFSLGLSYTHHFSDIWAWEAIDFHYSANVDTGLDVTLAERWSVAPTSNPEVQYLASTHAVFAPLFGKLALFNSSINYVETYFSLGGGVARFSDGFRPQLSFGPGIRLFIGQRVSARLDIRSSLVPDIPSGVDHVMKITFGMAFNFGTVRATETESTEEIDTSTGFEDLDELYPLSNPDRQKGEEKAE